MNHQHSFCILHCAFCIALAAASAFAQGNSDNPRVPDDRLWVSEPWEGSYVPGDYVFVKPHASLAGDGKLEIVWITRTPATGWVEWSQDDGKTWTRARTQKYGLYDVFERVHKTLLKGVDFSRPVRYRACSLPVLEGATGHVRYEGEEDVPWQAYKQWAAKTINAFTNTVENAGAKKYVEEGEVNPLVPEDGVTTILSFNDVHHAVPYYVQNLKHLGEGKVALAVFNGDIIDHSRSEEDIEKFLTSAMTYLGKVQHCVCRYVRGNHEVTHVFARHLPDYVGLMDDRLYGAATVGDTRIAFLDSAVYSPKTWWGNTEFEEYVSEQAEWLKKEVESDAWKNATWRLVFSHVPANPGVVRNCVKQNTQEINTLLYGILRDAKVDAFFGAHYHDARVIEPSDIFPFPTFIGGGSMPSGGQIQTLTRIDIRGKEGIAVRCTNYAGSNVYERVIRR
jgi:hypothetical protein